jgi:hypothetical protein
MLTTSDVRVANDVAAVVEDLINRGRLSEAADVVYDALVKMGYPYRIMAEVAVSKRCSRRSVAAPREEGREMTPPEDCHSPAP